MSSRTVPKKRYLLSFLSDKQVADPTSNSRAPIPRRPHTRSPFLLYFQRARSLLHPPQAFRRTAPRTHANIQTSGKSTLFVRKLASALVFVPSKQPLCVGVYKHTTTFRYVEFVRNDLACASSSPHRSRPCPRAEREIG